MLERATIAVFMFHANLQNCSLKWRGFSQDVGSVGLDRRFFALIVAIRWSSFSGRTSEKWFLREYVKCEMEFLREGR